MVWIYRLLTMSIPGNLDIYKGPSWPWSYCSWISNYLCNQCLSPPMLWASIAIRARCTTLCDKVCQWPSSKLQIYICMGDKEHTKYWQEWTLNKVSMVCDTANLQKILDILYQHHLGHTTGWRHERYLSWRITHAFLLCLFFFTNITDRKQGRYEVESV